jgi:syntaxin-binding protein 5
MESLKCIGRADLTLNGTFADLILLPSIGARGLNSKDDLFVLTNPGQIHYYDNDSLSALMSEQNRTSSVSAQEFPVLIPMNNPSLTVAKLIKLPSQLNSSKTLAEVISFVFQYFLLNLALIIVHIMFFQLISFTLGSRSSEN